VALFSRGPGGERPRLVFWDYADRVGAVAQKRRLLNQHGDKVTVAVSPAPKPELKTAKIKPPRPSVIEEPGACFWVSAYKAPQGLNAATVLYRGFATLEVAESYKSQLKLRDPDFAVCLTNTRPPGAKRCCPGHPFGAGRSDRHTALAAGAT
jgi:hypothetical protein